MKTLTKEDRYVVYCVLLAEAEEALYNHFSDIYSGFCNLFNDRLDIWVYDVTKRKVSYNSFTRNGTVVDSIKIGYPELHEFKPKNNGGHYWFDRSEEGWKKRICILKKITKKLEKELYGK